MAGKPNAYIGVSGKAKKILAINIGVGGKAKRIVGGWIGDSNGKARLFYGGEDMIKSIKRGYTHVSDLSATSTITSVNVDKSVIVYRGSTIPTAIGKYVELTNGTTVTATVDATNTGGNIFWEVIEYY